MQYFDLSTLEVGQAVRLLCSATDPDAARSGWKDRTPVKVTRQAAALFCEWEGGAESHVLDPAEVNPLHQALQRFAKARGVSYFVWIETDRTALLQAYAARRREIIAAGHRMDVAKRNRMQGGEERAARLYPYTAAECLAAARRDVEAGKRLYNSDSIWRGLGGSDGRVFAAYGEGRCRWLENPESKGLRFVGLAPDVGEGRDFGAYYLDDLGGGETVSGVVYQLPTRKGLLHFVYGYADPYNCDKNGRGPACLSLDLGANATVEAPGRVTVSGYNGRPSYSYWASAQEQHDSARKEALTDACRWADAMAEKMAEEERDYQESHRAGRDAREKAAEALAAGLAWVKAMRDLRAMFKGRNRLQAAFGLRDAIRAEVSNIRQLCEAYKEAREAAHDDLPRYASQRNEAWRDGYAEGV